MQRGVGSTDDDGSDSNVRKRDGAFFEAIALGKPPGAAAAIAGYTLGLVREWRKADPEFDKRWKDADDLAIERMESEADRRAVDGTDKPVFYQGERCGEIREYSDSLLIFRLKARRPEVYRERFEHSADPERPLTVVIKDF
ncbi:MAG: hypothetical protein GC190_21205 [Alphaproteobacteria bacterium]|nr:hypothetical protein [Alphaproteobacteria bacterium]